MIRLLGATLRAAGCAWIGFRASWEMRARGRAMGEVAEGLELLERELELGGAPLPHLVDDLSGRTRGQARLLFQDLRQALEHLDQEGLSRSWPTLIDRRRELGESGRACLYPLGELLGRYDSQAQIQGISAARRHLEEEREKDAEESRRQGRVCQALGLTGGAFLVILLI